ncbi:MAG: CPBP family intramembrane metalloprotease [Candidatus Lokiarchaeota archaeon]
MLKIVELLIYIQVISVALLTVLFHMKIGKYPQKLETIRSPKKELLEVMLIWLILFLTLTYIMLSVFYFPYLPYPGFKIVNGIIIPLDLILSFVLPLIILRVWRKGSDKENFMFNLPRDKKSTFFFLLIFVIYTIITFFIVGGEKESLIALLWGIVTPAISEEFFSRPVFISKLERAYGINTAWFVGGLLFGLLHIPNDFFGYFWFLYGENFFNSLGALLIQIIFGFMLGIMFIKTRSLIPCIIGHYVIDFLPSILAIIIPF